MVRRLEKELPEWLSFFSFPRHLRRKLRTTNVIERLFVEVRRRTRPMVCFVNVKSVDRIIYSIFHRFNLEWKIAPSKFLHMLLDITRRTKTLDMLAILKGETAQTGVEWTHKKTKQTQCLATNLQSTAYKPLLAKHEAST